EGGNVGGADENRRDAGNARGDAVARRLGDDGVLSDLLSDAHGDRIAGLAKRLPHRHRAFELAVVVFRLPGGLVGNLDRDGRIVPHRRPWNAGANGGGVDEWLECGTRLANPLGSAVVLVVLEVPPP